MGRLDERRWVETQYRDASNLDARVDLYRFAQDPVRWPDWLWERIGLRAGERVLDAGAGPGSLWRDNAARLPTDLHVTVSDLSEGMVKEARRRLADAPGAFTFERIDVQRIPKRDASFDVVIANHMLYHVPDRANAIGELHRVLVPGGRLYATTNAWTHLIELRELGRRFGLASEMLPPERIPDYFDLETGARELSARFPELRLFRRSDALEVTDADALCAYLDSMAERSAYRARVLERIRQEVALQIERLGSFHVSIAIGLFEAVKG
jgi:SAM-dependent methyltransferase